MTFPFNEYFNKKVFKNDQEFLLEMTNYFDVNYRDVSEDFITVTIQGHFELKTS